MASWAFGEVAVRVLAGDPSTEGASSLVAAKASVDVMCSIVAEAGITVVGAKVLCAGVFGPFGQELGADSAVLTEHQSGMRQVTLVPPPWAGPTTDVPSSFSARLRRLASPRPRP